MRIHNAVYLLLFLVPLLIWNGYRIYEKHFAKKDVPTVAADSGIKSTSDSHVLDTVHPVAASAMVTEPVNVNLPHPYIGYDFTIKGSVHSQRVNKIYFQLIKDNHTVFIDDESLKKLGYAVTVANDCSVFLFFNGAQVVASCENDQPSGNYQLTKNPHTLEAVKAPSNPLPLLDPVRG
jgi:hypothetical protein